MGGQARETKTFGDRVRQFYRKFTKTGTKSKSFPGSAEFWEERYATGANSGVGSYSKFAEFKAETINTFVATNDVASVIEFGCGDGNQLGLANYPKYLGLDVSETVLSLCRKKFSSDTSKSFKSMEEYDGETAELSLSLDVIYHLIEDEVFERYLTTLFNASSRYAIIYSSNYDEYDSQLVHIKHRTFSTWIEDNLSDWKLTDHVPNRYPYKGNYKKGSWADFYIYEKI